MDLSKVKLVVSDMDGTLLNSNDQISTLFFELFKELQKHNVHFVAASGRQYDSIIQKLYPIKNDITVVAENGGIAKRQENILLQSSLNSESILAIIPLIRSMKNTHFVLCEKDTAYIETKDEKFISLFSEFYTSYKIVEDITKIVPDFNFLKIAIYHAESSEKHIYPIIEHLNDDYLLKISGKNWLDISNKNANKGKALTVIQNQLNISEAETMVFGDYHNDIEMLQKATFSFSMKNAHEDIKKIANYSTESNDNFGVERILQKLIEAKKSD